MRPLVPLLFALLVPVHAWAQDTASPPSPAEVAPPEEEAEVAPPPDTSTSPEVAAEPRTEAAPPPAPPTVPPIMIAVLSTGHVPDDVIAATGTALVEQVTPLAGGRPVLPLAMEDMRARLAACADAPCQGAFLGETGVIGAIIARLSRRTTRGPVAITLEMIDPMSGAPRVTPITGQLTDAATTPATLAAMVEQLRGSMFSPPPPPPTLLVTVNVDGATVMIDGTSVGESPIASQRLTPGRHVVMVTRSGYSGARREVELDPGEQERLDLTLETAVLLPTQEMLSDGTVQTRVEPPWYEQWYVWVGVGAGVLVITGIIIGVVVATQPPPVTPDPQGIPLPALHF
jgi:hypothetical protein